MKAFFFLLITNTLVIISSFGHSIHTPPPINYFVSTTGNDNNPGTSLATAFRTITKALSVVQPGGIIFVKGGSTPYLERINWPTSGTSTAMITLTSYDSNPVYLSGASGGGQPALVLISGKSNIRITNFRLHTNYRNGAEGIHIKGAATNIQLDNCHVYNIGWNSSMSAGATDPAQHNAHGILVQGNSSNSLNAISITNCQVYNINTGYSEGLTITGNVYNFFLNNIIVHDITNIGIDIAGHYPNPGVSANVNFARTGTIKACTVYNCNVPAGSQLDIPAGIYVDGARDIIIEGNRSYRNGVGFSVGCENPNKNAQYIYMRNNIATDNIECGLFLGSSTASSMVLNCKVTNNTFAQNYSKNLPGAEVSLYNSASCEFKQNIFLPRRADCVAIGTWNNYTITNFLSSYNLYWRIGGNTSYMTANVTQGTNAVFGDPKFISTILPSPNYHLQTGSKAINRGDAAFVIASGELDIDAQARIQNGRVDIGADESPYTALANPLAEQSESDHQEVLSVFPNPATSNITIKFTEPYTGILRVSDLRGQVVIERNISNELEARLTIEELPNGVYWIHAGETVLRVVKQ